MQHTHTQDAAEKFMAEANVKPDLDLSSIEERMKIRNAVQSGDIETAISLVNDLNPEVWWIATAAVYAGVRAVARKKWPAFLSLRRCCVTSHIRESGEKMKWSP